MNNSAKWIWLDPKLYPLYQKSEITAFDNSKNEYKFVVGEFKRTYNFQKTIAKAIIEVCADVKFTLHVNGNCIGCGPVCQGGDYAGTTPMPVQYYNTYELEINGQNIDFYAEVQKNITVQCDMSKGKPGFILSARLIFADGSQDYVVTGKDWLCRVNNSRYALGKTDFTVTKDLWEYAFEAENVWNLKKAPIKMIAEEKIYPKDFSPIKIGAKQTIELSFDFDKIYSGRYCVKAHSKDSYLGYNIFIADYERYENKAVIAETITGRGEIDFRGLEMRSVGAVKLIIVNYASEELYIDDFHLQFCHYPVSTEGSFECSEKVFNDAYELGKHTLKICRQSIELDSPAHQENLGCTGDYFVASLMNYFTFGDTSLTRLDIIRTADYLKTTNGFMFHTIYSMIWLLMLKDYYIFSGDKDVIREVLDAMSLLLSRFDGYTDSRGIIVNPPNYMFVDWLEIDGISLHHPPAALGQACLNAFYYGGLKAAIYLMKEIDADCCELQRRADSLKQGFNKHFYDPDKKLYFDGLNEKYKPNDWLPENTDKRYFSQHTNTLAVLFDIAPENRQAEIMDLILTDSSLITPQPYFMHFVLEALYKTNLFEKHGITQLMRWKKLTEFQKGMQEGWFDVSGYGFDYSHVWGGTPTYQLPSKLMGFEMIKPGFGEIKLKPNLFGLEFANIKMPTPYGYITVRLKKGLPPQINVPDEIPYTVE